MTRYLRAAETNKLIRNALKVAFPGVKFSVKGDNACRVTWTDGPEAFAVEALLGPYRNGGFNGSIGMAYNSTSYLLKDGTVISGRSSGTTGSMGSREAYAFVAHEGAEEISMGVTYIWTTRTISPEFEAKCARAFAIMSSEYRCRLYNGARLRKFEGDETDGHFLARNIAA